MMTLLDGINKTQFNDIAEIIIELIKPETLSRKSNRHITHSIWLPSRTIVKDRLQNY